MTFNVAVSSPIFAHSVDNLAKAEGFFFGGSSGIFSSEPEAPESFIVSLESTWPLLSSPWPRVGPLAGSDVVGLMVVLTKTEASQCV